MIYNANSHVYKKIVYILVFIIFCFAGCSESDNYLESEASSETEGISSEASVESSTDSSLGSVDSSEDLSSELSEAASESSATAEENSEKQPVAITPNEDISVNEAPETDGSPKPNLNVAVDEINKDAVYESGKITITRDMIDGTSETLSIDDEEVKRQILDYVDTMQPSEYNAMNTPPGGDAILNVSVHKDEIIELYIFSDRIVDGNALGKNLQDTDVTKWYIVNKDAFPYLLDLLN